MITPDQRRGAARALVMAEPDRTGEPDGLVSWLGRLCRATVRTLPATGCGITLMTGDGVREVAAVSAPLWAQLEQVQSILGEGPGLDAYGTRSPVLEPDLDAEPTGRWPGYRAVAARLGVRAVFVFPLQQGAARFGTFSAYRSTSGTLSVTSLTQALTFAEIVVEAVLDGQERAGPDRVDASLGRVLDSQAVVHQAQGMTMVDLGVSLADAMARLRAHAYASDRPLHEVARDVVDGRLRLEQDEA